MSTKRDKFLENAQKFILKGQLDRAIKDYEQVVALDPNDIRHRQRLAELMVRAGRKEEAVGEYEAIGKYYGDNAFYLKAIAVYKQIQKLDPDSIRISYNLATLNEKQGLTGNALAEYSRVYSYYDRMGKRPEALDILEKMAALDPDNLNTRLKFAETHVAAGNTGKAYDDFVHIALLLRSRGDESAFRQLCGRVAYLLPDRKEFVLDLAASRLAGGDAAGAIPELREIVEKEPGNLKAWQLLADAVRTSGGWDELRGVYQEMARQFPDEISPRQGLIQCALDDGNDESALFLLRLHASLFLEKGASQFLEWAYLALLERMPEDAQLLDGAKSLYEAAGDQAKLDGILARLASLGLAGGSAAEERGQQEIHSVEEARDVAEDSTEPARETWTEEIDLSLEEDGPIGAGFPSHEEQEPAGFDAGPEAGEPGEPAGVTLEPDISEERYEPQELPGDGVEVALELELGEDELTELAGLCGHPGQAEPVFGDIAPEALEEEGADGTAHLDPATPFELDLSGDDYNELAELLAETETEDVSLSAGHDKYSLDGLFSAFKKGVDQQLDEEDTETHYNLGIAYKEMGLYEDAIAEFDAAALDPRRKVDCLTLQGICCREKGDLNRAEEVLRKGLALPELAAEHAAPLKYELALLHETAGRMEDALLLYREITAITPGFRDTAEKIASLLGGEAQDYYDLDLIELQGEEE